MAGNAPCSSAEFVESSRGGAYDSRNSGPNQKTDFRRYGLRKPLLAGRVDEIFRGNYHDFNLPYWSGEHDKFSSNDRL